MTVSEVCDACKKHKYVLFRFPSGNQMGVNSKIVEIAMKNRDYNSFGLTDYIGFTPCSYMEYISKKHAII